MYAPAISLIGLIMLSPVISAWAPEAKLAGQDCAAVLTARRLKRTPNIKIAEIFTSMLGYSAGLTDSD